MQILTILFEGIEKSTRYMRVSKRVGKLSMFTSIFEYSKLMN